ncbi:hypothetical protein LOC68_21065 [Blastopirellula sp. JC732]|uniref:Uncharacterized protein n=1 Tax=Blastopirellula sediminis TaxID=2894196 RepID=A0A9X1MSM9_9BACT|nr:hypothetical protein [Blastopirellula sediminis]MCC9605811.1 hypothetical protein [Blastopirellula sediminis]MCC9630889.1 hypothetical protein [Blastopirellula sediminis]
MTNKTNPRINRHAPCGICGGSDFAWGTLIGRPPINVPSVKLVFVSEQDSIWKQLRGVDTAHRACRDCGAIQTFLV